MEIYKNEFNHIIIKDDNENVCELFENRTLEKVKEDIKQCQEEGLNCLMCEMGILQLTN